ncbi:hypothetical protein Tbd_0192 [Thiobacillus denitrificans ATCC 25259]|uniref:Uncharacterized protein n=1 Tax=Thiobacillus denitrificans (strain ATCC 25259 / T1) TaxID=292415 RepID=Q3SMA2_THIDA|nr:hypothetical protein Tbd_0192 [Thiobacillus denitrificans ATCC 25259]
MVGRDHGPPAVHARRNVDRFEQRTHREVAREMVEVENAEGVRRTVQHLDLVGTQRPKAPRLGVVPARRPARALEHRRELGRHALRSRFSRQLT